MPNIASLLKEEIARQTRKELRGSTEKLKKSSTRYRSDIAELKRRLVTLEQQLAHLQKHIARSAPPSPVSQAVRSTTPRFSATNLRKLRGRLDISAPVLASILGISPQTVYNWEAGTTRPSPEQIVNIGILRGLGKREVQARLKQAS